MPSPYHRQRRILFVGEIASTHAQNWMTLTQNEFEIHAFSFPGKPPADLNIPTEIPLVRPELPLNPLHSGPGRLDLRIRRLLEGSARTGYIDWVTPALQRTIARVKPDIIHTFGLEPAGALISRLRKDHKRFRGARWVAQLRGGSDLELRKFDAQEMGKTAQMLQGADAILSDNVRNFQYLSAAGVESKRFASISPLPGSGGVDIESLHLKQSATSDRRVILWPKAYNTAYMQAFPILEALRISWPRLQPCKLIVLYVVQNEVREWIRAVSSDLNISWDIREHVSREEVFDLLQQSRVMLAPSLIDGVPNMLYEAMATGAVPIVSPLNTIMDVVRDNENIIAARNLYPNEIADALIRVMNDDGLANRIAGTNYGRVRELADKGDIRKKVCAFYRSLCE